MGRALQAGEEQCRLLREAKRKVERAREGLGDHPFVVQLLGSIDAALAAHSPDD